MKKHLSQLLIVILILSIPLTGCRQDSFQSNVLTQNDNLNVSEMPALLDATVEIQAIEPENRSVETTNALHTQLLPEESIMPDETETSEEFQPKELPNENLVLEDKTTTLADEKPVLTRQEEPQKPSSLPPYRVQVDVTNQVITVFGQEDSGQYKKVVRQMICSTGKPSTPTPLGSFVIQDGPNDRGVWGYFTKFNVWARYWTRIRGGILFHSIIYAKRDESTLRMSTYHDLGKPVSAGCIRMLVEDAKWIYENIRKGTVVDVIQGEKNPALTAALKTSGAQIPVTEPEATVAPVPTEVPVPAEVPLLPEPTETAPLFPRPSDTDTGAPVDIEIFPTTHLNLVVKASQELTVYIEYADQTVSDVSQDILWTVSDPTIAKMQGAHLTALSPGTTEVNAKIGNLSATLYLTVPDDISSSLDH